MRTLSLLLVGPLHPAYPQMKLLEGEYPGQLLSTMIRRRHLMWRSPWKVTLMTVW